MKNLKSLFLVGFIALMGCANPEKTGLALYDQSNDSLIHHIFKSKVYLGLSGTDSSNRYHAHLQIFNSGDVQFFPLYSSQEKLDELTALDMIMPEFKPFDGVLFASLMNDSMIYIINYALTDEIVISGKQVKSIMQKDIDEFQKEYQDLIK